MPGRKQMGKRKIEKDNGQHFSTSNENIADLPTEMMETKDN